MVGHSKDGTPVGKNVHRAVLSVWVVPHVACDNGIAFNEGDAAQLLRHRHLELCGLNAVQRPGLARDVNSFAVVQLFTPLVGFSNVDEGPTRDYVKRDLGLKQRNQKSTSVQHTLKQVVRHTVIVKVGA